VPGAAGGVAGVSGCIAGAGCVLPLLGRLVWAHACDALIARPLHNTTLKTLRALMNIFMLRFQPHALLVRQTPQ
jgi:hypothetical protein